MSLSIVVVPERLTDKSTVYSVRVTREGSAPLILDAVSGIAADRLASDIAESIRRNTNEVADQSFGILAAIAVD